jgi:hypothetical protein
LVDRGLGKASHKGNRNIAVKRRYAEKRVNFDANEPALNHNSPICGDNWPNIARIVTLFGAIKAKLEPDRGGGAFGPPPPPQSPPYGVLGPRALP